MKIYSISDNIDTYTGLRTVGIDGVVVHTQDELDHVIKKVLADSDIGILLVTEKTAKNYPDAIDNIKLNRMLPLVVEIPDRHGSGRKRDFITLYIKNAIGVKLD